MMPSITFTPDGTGRALYTEAIDLGRLGRLSIRRATRIEFDNSAGVWKVYMPYGRFALFSSPSRQACLDWETQYLETQENHAHELPQRPGAVTAGAGSDG